MHLLTQGIHEIKSIDPAFGLQVVGSNNDCLIDRNSSPVHGSSPALDFTSIGGYQTAKASDRGSSICRTVVPTPDTWLDRAELQRCAVFLSVLKAHGDPKKQFQCPSRTRAVLQLAQMLEIY